MTDMTATVEETHTAISSWSGFLYQGKIAIYHVLELLKNQAACVGFKLQLDYLEDFAILDSDDLPKSLHQVKALKADTYGAYSIPLTKLQQKGAQASASLNFHTARQIRAKPVAEIETDHAPVKLYKYGSDYWCAVGDVDPKIEEQIREILVVMFPNDPNKITPAYLALARGFIDQIVLKQVLLIHRAIHECEATEQEAACKKTILFSDFINVLNKDLNQEALGDEYYFHVLLSYFHRYYQEYCLDSDLNEEEGGKLSLYMKEIGKLDKNQMIRFIRNIIPHRQFAFNSLQDFHENSFNGEDIKDAFLEILRVLKKTNFADEGFLSWSSEGEFFVPTAIKDAQALMNKTCERIVKNALKTDLEIMYEKNHLITMGIDADSVLDGALRITQDFDMVGDEKNRLTKWQGVSLIRLDKAKGVINV